MKRQRHGLIKHVNAKLFLVNVDHVQSKNKMQ